MGQHWEEVAVISMRWTDARMRLLVSVMEIISKLGMLLSYNNVGIIK